MRSRFAVSVLCLVPVGVLATTMASLPLAARAQRADRVVLAQVVSTRTVVEHDDPHTMRTLTEVVVGETLKGPASQRLTISQVGGRWGLWESHIPQDATFRQGETVLLLLHCRGGEVCALDGLGEGKVLLVGGDALSFDVSQGRYQRQGAAQVLAQVRAAVSLPAAPPLGAGVSR